MGRNRDAYWASRRSLQAYRAKHAYMAAPRAYAFDREAVIQGARGRACLEQILTPPKDTPQASCRVIARWTGLLRPGSVITVADRSLFVLRVRPMSGRRTVAHILCRGAEGRNRWNEKTLEERMMHATSGRTTNAELEARYPVTLDGKHRARRAGRRPKKI